MSNDNSSAFRDVIIGTLPIVPDERGNIYKFMSNLDVADIYITTVRLNRVKAWHGYKTKKLSYVNVRGLLKVVLWDRREDSATFGEIEEHLIGPENYCYITLPPGVWHGFKSVEDTCVVVVAASEPYNDSDVLRCSPKGIEYEW